MIEKYSSVYLYDEAFDGSGSSMAKRSVDGLVLMGERTVWLVFVEK